ncbi:MAG: DUF1573 domain-containing protein [Planctomycetota bacterium]|jgi:hypothetical protein
MKTYETLSLIVILLIVSIFTVGCDSAPKEEPLKVESQEVEKLAETVEEASPAEKVEKPVVAPEPKKATKDIQKKADADQGVPIVTVKNTVLDLGNVGPGSSHSGQYEFTNTGKATLKIQRIQSTCGCTVPELKIKEYAPGESGTIKVKFKAPKTKGNVSKHLYIISNDSKTPRFGLEIKCQVMVKVDVTPENVDLRFDQDNAGMGDIVVKSLDNREFSIKSVVISRETMKIDFDPAQKAKQFTLKPIVDLAKLDKYPTGTIQIKADHPQSGSLRVRYTAKPNYEVSRPRIILQNIEPGKMLEKDVVIRSNYGKPVEITSVNSKNGYMEVTSQEADGAGVKLTLAITPPMKTATARRYITDKLTITLKDETKLSIRCSGWFRLK